VFRLERGVTGFRFGKEPELPEISVQRFRGACYEAARMTGGAVERVAEKDYPRNFHSAVIVGPPGRTTVLCNAVHPWVAFVEEGTGDTVGPGAFVDPPACAQAFPEMGFVVMGRELLESPLSVVDTAALGKAEWIQIRSWQPTCVGQTVFNSWD
jgi:hypothetical protein